MRKLITVISLLLSFSTLASAASEEITLTSPETQVSILELYTSQGCSSCPPADKWLSNLKNDERVWTSLIPMAFHVNYWDYIGWKDKFASPAFSLRQRSHAAAKNIKGVYTPGFLLNGREWRSFYGFRQLDRASKNKVGVLSLIIKDKKLTADFKPSAKNNADLILNVALLGFDLATKINAGENNGRTLSHDFVVLGYKRVRLDSVEQAFTAITELPKPKQQASKFGLAAWVSPFDDLTPIQATGGYIEL